MNMIKFDSQEFEELIRELNVVCDAVDEQIASINKAWTVLQVETDKFDGAVHKLLGNMSRVYLRISDIISKGEAITSVYERVEHENQILVNELKEPSINEKKIGGSITKKIVNSYDSIATDRELYALYPMHYCMSMQHEIWLIDIVDEMQGNSWMTDGLSGNRKKIIPDIHLDV
jgi:hypothetical protein